jgi:hypothetical protein
MRLKTICRWAAGICFSLAASVPVASLAEDDAHLVRSSQPFLETVQAVENEIINRGYSIDYHGFIGDMLERTASDVGADRKLYEDAEFLTFCSAVLSRKMMEAEIRDIALCPYIIIVYSTVSEPEIVNIGFRPLPAGGVRDEVNALLTEIVNAAADGF